MRVNIGGLFQIGLHFLFMHYVFVKIMFLIF